VSRVSRIDRSIDQIVASNCRHNRCVTVTNEIVLSCCPPPSRCSYYVQCVFLWKSNAEKVMECSRLFVLLVVVDLVVPKKRLRRDQSAAVVSSGWSTCLVAVAPEVVLGTDVLVRIFDLVFKRRCVLGVLGVGIVSHLCVGDGEDETRDGDTAQRSVRAKREPPRAGRSTARAGDRVSY
jgi:hypothetical protein